MKLFALIKGVLARAIVGISGILIARHLSKDDYGLIVSIATIAAFFLTVSRLGLNEYSIVRAAKARTHSTKRAYITLMDKLQNSTVLLMFVPGLALALLLIPREIASVTVIWIFFLVYARGYIDSQRVGVISATLQTNGNNQKFVDSQLVFSTAAILSLVALYAFNLEKLGYLSTSLIASLLMYCIGTNAYKIYLNNGAATWPRLPTIRQFKIGIRAAVLKNSSYLLSDVMAFAYTQGSAIVLISVTTSAEVARYSVIASLITAGYIIPGVIYQWTLPLLAESLSSKETYLTKAKKSAIQIASIVFPISLTMVIWDSLIVHLLLGEKYRSSASVLSLMAIVYFLHSLCFIPAAILTSLGLQQKRLQLQMLSAAVGISTTAIAGASLGGIAAAYACLAAEVLLLVGYTTSGYIAIKSREWKKK
ncbi:oligosaccharide flippase family protein [Rhodoferax bucti]|uniref:oligosaccharide flippase family protein n=1 Tax=Rhodoferax bucti TaxID=2576305 RepID=UPI001108E403|nr:oligosaccharide flippase family protein [Rhodoferax bucti]